MYTLKPVRSRDAFMGAARGLAAAEFAWKPAPEGWSVVRNSGARRVERSAGTVQGVAGPEDATNCSLSQSLHQAESPGKPILPRGNFTSFAFVRSTIAVADVPHIANGKSNQSTKFGNTGLTRPATSRANFYRTAIGDRAKAF